MKCLVTAGPTYEELDRVRRLTNFSSGRLGTWLVNFLGSKGHETVLLRGSYAMDKETPRPSCMETFTTTDDLGERLARWRLEGIEAVFHAAAVNDFRFGRIYEQEPDGRLTEWKEGKIASRSGKHLLAELVATPKILTNLRGWYPRAFLAGWKYEVDGGRKEVVEKGLRQMRECRTDACVLNGPAWGLGFGLLGPGEREAIVYRDPTELFERLEVLMRKGS